MPRRLLHFRFTFALIGFAAIIAGALLETVWLAGPGVAAAGFSDLVGILQARARFPLPADRALRGAAEGLPALAVAAFQPAAIGVTVVVVVFALMANGIHTVSVSRGISARLNGAETARRVATSVASLLVLSLPLAASSQFDLPGLMGLSSLQLAGIGIGLASLASVIALVHMWMQSGRSAPNVDT
jgi:hypothetical protein